jgi:ABC-2 type transport system permease protein
MTALLQAELLKLRTTRAVIGYLVALVLLTVIGTGSEADTHELFQRDDPEFQRNVLSIGVASPLIALLVGITLVTLEWRHGTITRTLLVTPRRERMLASKEAAGALFGAAFGALALAVALVVAGTIFAFDDISLHVDAAFLGRLGVIVVAAAIWGAIGVGVGGLVQNQTTALVVAIVWLLIVENLMDFLLDKIDLQGLADLLPGRALSAFDGSHSGGLAMGLGGLVGLAYVALFAALAWLRVRRQDIT